MSTMKPSSISPTGSNVAVERVRAPRAGVITVVVLAGGLAAWTAQRITAAELAQGQVAQKKAEDAAQAARRAKAPPRVAVVQPIKTTWLPHVDLEGTLAAQESASLSFKVPGKLARLSVRVGAEVKLGAPLAALETAQAAAQLAASAAQVRAAQAQLELADDTAKRTSVLAQSGSIQAASAVQSTQQRALALAQLDAARAQLALARATFREHTLLAPFPGTVVSAPDGVGAVVGPGQTLFQLANLKTLKLATSVSESDANLLHIGSKVSLESEAGRVEGRISSLLDSLEERTRRVPVQVEFDNPGSLRAGSFVRARVAAGEAVDVLRLPHQVLRPGSQDEVLVVVPGQAAALSARKVVYALDAAGNLLVRSGIAAGEAVVSSPEPDAKTGDVVVVIDSQPGTGRQ